MKKQFLFLALLIVSGNAFAAYSLNCTVTQKAEDGDKVLLKDNVLQNQSKTSQNGKVSLLMSNKVMCAADGGPCSPGPGETILLFTVGNVNLHLYTMGSIVTDQTVQIEKQSYNIRCLLMPTNDN